VDSYSSHPDTSARGTSSEGSVKSTEMLLMRRFLRENTCKTQLGAKFGARRVKSMFRYCINVGERVMMCRGLSLLTFTVYHIAALENCTVTGLTMVYVKGAWRGTLTRWLRMELSSIRNGVRSASRICKVFWPRTVSIVSTWRACSVR